MRLGRPPEIDPATEEFIGTRRRAGLPLRAITQELNAGDVAAAASGYGVVRLHGWVGPQPS